MNLATTFMNLPLRNPLVAGASPLSHDIDSVRALEEAGIAAVVMHSLFEEQIVGGQLADLYHARCFADSRAAVAEYFPDGGEYVLDRDAYLQRVAALKKAVSIPVIASLNACTSRAWTQYARLIEEAGADALELNIYFVAADPQQSSQAIETRVLDIVGAVTGATKIPVAVKLPPFFTGLSHFAAKIEEAGADGLVIFNRFYEPDINLQTMEARAAVCLSHPSELLLRLHWLAILSPQLNLDLAVTGGVHDAEDAIKAVAAGASCAQLVSVLLEHGPERVAHILSKLESWMTENKHHSLRSLRGAMALKLCPDPEAYERGSYLRTLLAWKDDLDIQDCPK